MKDSLLNLIVRAWQNKHTSTSAVVLFVATVVGILWPQHKDKADEIARAAIVYGLITAGDARASMPANKPEETPKNP